MPQVKKGAFFNGLKKRNNGFFTNEKRLGSNC